MAPKVYDRVKEYTVSTGVGGITFVGAFNGFQKFSDVLLTGETTYYVIEENDKWEVGIGTYGSNNLERDTVLSSSNGGSKINLGGSGVVSITYPAGRAAFSDEVDYVSGIAVYSSGQAITNRADISTNSSNINYVSGVANYASGQAVDNESQISSVSGWADSTFIKVDDDSYVSGIATYASGQAIVNESDIATNTSNISTNTARVEYASGQAILNQGDIASVSGLIGDADFLPGATGSLIDQNTQQIASVSGWSEVYTDNQDAAISGWVVSQDHTGVAVSGWANATFATDIDLVYVSGVAAGAGGVTIEQLEYVSGIALYSSGQAINNQSEIISVSGWAGVYADAGDASVSGWASSTFLSSDDDAYVSGVASYASGQAILNESEIVSVSGWAESYVDSQDHNAIAVSGWADSTFIKIDDDSYVSGVAAYASGQAIENETDIEYVSGIAVYASGNTLQRVTDNGASTTNAITITDNNITASSGLFDSLDMTPLGNGSQPAYQEGVVFYDSENHTLSLYNDEADVTLQLGQEEFLRVRNNTGATIQNGTAVLINGAHGNAAPTISGAIATSEASSQVVGLATHSIETDSFGYITTYGIVRDVDTSAFSAGDEVFLSATQIGSGVAVAPVIPNYKISLGHVINSASSNGSILVQVGNPKLGGGDLKSEAPLNMSGVPFVTSISDTNAGGSQTDPLFIFDSGNRQLQIGSGVQLLDGAPTNTSNVLYNEGGVLKFNGSTVDTTYDDTYVSGIATYASGQAISNQSNISTNTSNISSNTAKVNYASGLAIANETDISYVSGVAAKTFTVTAADSNNYTFDGMGLNSDTDPTIYLHKGHTYYFDKQTSSHPFRVSTSNGGAAYQDADGNNIEISGQGVLKFEVPQDAPDKLYYYCTSHASMNGVIYTTNNVDEIIHVSGIAFYASGQAITNESNIETNASNISINTGKVNYASGQAIENEIDIAYISGIAVYGSGNSGGGDVTTEQLEYVSGIAVYASGEAGSGGAYDDTYISGIAVYASGQVDLASAGNAEASKAIILDSDKSFYGVKHGNFDEFDSWVSSSGVSIGPSGLVLERNTPSDTTDTLYNVLGTLYFNGSQLASAGGASAEAQYASGQAIENEIDIAYISGIAVYASGNSGGGGGDVTTEQLEYVSGIAVYGSGLDSFLLNPSGAGGISVTSDPNFVIFSGDATLARTSDLNAVSGIAVYASGNSGGGGSSLTAGSGVVIDGSDRINIYGGSGHFQNIQLETTGTEDALLLTSTDAGSDAAPVISTMRDSASPADGDYLGQLKFKGRSDTGTERVYAKITGKTLDVTNGTEDGVIEIAVRANGSNEIVSRIRNDGIRILNDNNLCVEDGGNVGIRNISPSYPLDVEGDAHVASGLLVGDTLDVSGVSTFDQVATFQSGIKTNINTEADAATITFDMDQSNVHMVTLGDNRTLAVSNVDVGQKFLVRLQQDSTGSRTVTWWGNIQWAEGGTEPTLTTTGGKADLFGFLSPSGGYYDGFVVGQNI
jgi:hypothetical protein